MRRSLVMASVSKINCTFYFFLGVLGGGTLLQTISNVSMDGTKKIVTSSHLDVRWLDKFHTLPLFVFGGVESAFLLGPYCMKSISRDIFRGSALREQSTVRSLAGST